MPSSARVAVAVLAGSSVLALVAALGWLWWWHDPGVPAGPNTPATDGSARRGPVESPRSRTPEERPGVAAAFPEPRFVDVTRAAGVDFTFFRGETGKFWVPEVNGGGAAFVDFDGDGLLDLYLVDGCQLPADPKDFRHTSRLYRNEGGGRFRDITGRAGVGHNGYGQGCGSADYDNDGFEDLYVTCYGSNVLYHNLGDGTFSNETDAAAADSPLWSSSCAFGDLDLDGAPELYVCNYVDFDPAHAPVCLNAETEQLSYCGPRMFGPLPHALLRNLGNGTFRDISREPDTTLAPGKGLGVVIADLDNDGRPDLYIANDTEPNYLLHNRPGGPSGFSLQDMSVEWTAALNAEGLAQASMGVACGDFDEDGLLDLVVTNFYSEHLTLYRNVGTAGFADVSSAAGVVAATRARLGWGTGFIDYDNDGWLDLFATNGYLLRGHSRIPDMMPPTLMRNTGQGRFVEMSELAGPYFQSKWIGRGVAFGDYDDDGRMDIVVVHHYEPTVVLHNETVSPCHALMLEFVGRRSNRSAINVRVEAVLKPTEGEPSPRKLVRDVLGGGSYQSSSDRRIVLGIGPRDRVEKLTVRWPSGHVDEWENLSAERWFLLVEGLAPRERQALVRHDD